MDQASTTSPTRSSPVSRADYYDDPGYDYPRFWVGREYEHAAEEMALRRLLAGRHFRHALDIGGGYGRWGALLATYADRVTLAEPSQKQLALAGELLHGHPVIDLVQGRADSLPFGEGTVDLAILIRVVHHLTVPTPAFREIARVLSDDGCAVIEVANGAHAINRLKHWLKGRAFPLEPIDIRSPANQHEGEPPFVNHNPRLAIRQLHRAGLQVEQALSVSNLRAAVLKRALPHRLMIRLERMLQSALAKSYFGPSLFFRVKRACRAGDHGATDRRGTNDRASIGVRDGGRSAPVDRSS